MMKKICTLLLAVCMVTVMMPAMAFADGGASPETHTVNFGTGSWTVGNVTVLADKSGETSLTMNDVITLTGFDASTMKAQLVASDGFTIELTVTEGRTSLSAKTGDGVLPDTLTFSIVSKDNYPPATSAGTLTFTCQSNAVTGGSIFYKLGTSDTFVKVSEDSENNTYASVSLNDATSITIKLIANEGYSLDDTLGVVLRVNGTEKFKKKGSDIVDFTSDKGHTFNLSDLVGSESSISQSSFELEFGFGQDSNNGSEPPGPDQPGEGDNRPEHFGDNGYISFDTNSTDGIISYACVDDVSKLENLSWTPVSVDDNSNCYVPVDMSSLGEDYSTVFFRIEGGNSKHLDLDRGFSVKNDQKRIYNVCGTYNDDPNYDADNEGAQPADKRGLKDMYDNKRDQYIIPVDMSTLVNESKSARIIEFRWTDMISLYVEVDDASQYMIAKGKTEIGIATGKGFSISVQDGCKVSVPALQDIDLGGNEEKYFIDLKVNRSYFIPYISINGKSYETFDPGNGGVDFTNIAAAVPAEEFKALIANNNGTLTIHLTVDKSVPVGSAEGKAQVDMQASFNMINDGNTPKNTPVDKLDVSVALTAQEATLSDEDRGEGAVEAYEITMDIANKNETEFIVPIDISIAGNFDGDENGYSVIREHEGEIPQAIPCTIEKGEDSSTLSFSTSKFSKFTIMYGSSSGGSIPAPSEPADNTITNSGSGSDASTSVDVSDQTTVTDSKAEITIDADLGSKIVENAINNKSSEVVINAGTSAGDSSESTVALPASTVKALAGEEVQASVTIKTDNATVQLDKNAVSAVAEQTGSDADVKLVVQTKEQNKNKVEIELTLETSDGTKISDFKGGSVTVTVPVSEELAGKKIVCVYIDGSGKYTKMEGSLSADRKSYTFTTGHFSTYAILEEAEAEAVISKQKIKVGASSVKLYTSKGGKLRVKASAKNATGYKVYYKKSTWKNYKTYTKGKVKTLDKTFKKLSKGKYTVKVKAYYKDYDGTGSVIWGKLSGEKKITVRR